MKLLIEVHLLLTQILNKYVHIFPFLAGSGNLVVHVCVKEILYEKRARPFWKLRYLQNYSGKANLKINLISSLVEAESGEVLFTRIFRGCQNG